MRERMPSRKSSTFMLAGDEAGDVDVSRLEADLAIDRGNLGEALAGHPDLYYRAALMAARLESRVAVAEMDARAALSRQMGALRDLSRDHPQPPTENQLETRARQSSEVDKAERHAAELRRKWLAARALAMAYEQRGRALEALAARKSNVPR